MPTQAVITPVGIGATVGNVFGSSRIRLIPNVAGAKYQVVYLSTAAAIDLSEEVFVGAANPVESSPVSAINRFPQSPEDVVTSFMANAGEEITVRVVSSSAAIVNHTGKLVITRVR